MSTLHLAGCHAHCQKRQTHFGTRCQRFIAKAFAIHRAGLCEYFARKVSECVYSKWLGKCNSRKHCLETFPVYLLWQAWELCSQWLLPPTQAVISSRLLCVELLMEKDKQMFVSFLIITEWAQLRESHRTTFTTSTHNDLLTWHMWHTCWMWITMWAQGGTARTSQHSH